MEGGGSILGRNVTTHCPNQNLRNRRQTLYNITNTINSTSTNTDKNVPYASEPINYAEIMKEHSHLMRVLAEKNKMIELSGLAIQKLRNQNRDLAQKNSEMLGELNSGKDKLKNMQHELKSNTLVIQEQKKEIKEKNNTIKQLTEQLRSHQRKMGDLAINLTGNKQNIESQCKMEIITPLVIHEDAPEMNNNNNNRKLIRSNKANKGNIINSSNIASINSLTVLNDKRKSIGSKNGPKAQNSNISSCSNDKRRRSTRLSLKTPEQEELNQEINQELNQEIKEEINQEIKESQQEDIVTIIEDQAEERESDVVMVKIKQEEIESEERESEERETDTVMANIKQEERESEEREREERERVFGSRRDSVRPPRRAAEKVVSYKEKPLNVKMRRLD